MKNFDGHGCRIHLTIRQLQTKAITLGKNPPVCCHQHQTENAMARNGARTVLVSRCSARCVRAAAAMLYCQLLARLLLVHVYPFPGRSLYCCGRAVDGVMMALSEYKWSIKHAQREQKYSMCVLDSPECRTLGCVLYIPAAFAMHTSCSNKQSVRFCLWTILHGYCLCEKSFG